MPSLHKFGRNSDLDMNVPETVWAAGGVYVFPSVDETLSIVSDDAADAAAGTGQRTIQLEGLDISWDPLVEVVTLDGTTPVVTTGAFLRLNRVRGVASGSGDVNAGAITITAPTQGLTLAVLIAGLGQSELGLYSTPANSIVEIDEIFTYPFKSQAAFYEVRMMLREFEESWNLKSTFGAHTQSSGTVRGFKTPFRLPAKSDLEFIGEVSANSVGISVEFSGNLITRG